MSESLCPCKRVKCPRHGDCAACRAHHRAVKKTPPFCEKPAKNKRRAPRQN